MTAAELLVKITTQGNDELAKTSSIINSVGEGTRLTGAQLKTFDSTLNSLVGSGKSVTQALQQMAASNGVLSGSIRGTSADLLLQIQAANGDEAAIRKLSGAHQHLVTDVQAASSAIRVFEGASPIRAVENFATKVLGLGGAFQALFPIVGAVATFEVVTHSVGALIDKLEGAYTATERIRGGFRNITAESNATNDALKVTGDKLEESIAKLEKKPYNGVKLAIDEAVLSADKLGESLTRDNAKLYEFIRTSASGVLDRVLAGEGNLASVLFSPKGGGKDVQEFVGGKTGFGGVQGNINDITAGGRSNILAAGSNQAGVKAAQDKLNADLIAAYQKAIAELDKQFGANAAFNDGTVRSELARGTRRDFQDRITQIQLTGKNEDLEQHKARAEADRYNSKPDDALAKRRAEVEKQLRYEIAGLYAKELTGVAAVNADLDRRIEKLKEENLLTQSTYQLEIQRAQVFAAVSEQKLIEKTTHGAHLATVKEVAGFDLNDNRTQNAQSKAFLDSLRRQGAQDKTDERTYNALDKILSISDQADADGVQRGLQVTVKRNQTLVNGGSLTPQGAASGDYSARVDAANQILAIQTRGLDVSKLDQDLNQALADYKAGKQVELSDQELKDIEKLATLRKKYSDEIYQAEAQNEEALDSLRAKDLDKYKKVSDDIFNALIDKQHGSAFDLRKLLKSTAIDQGRQIFSNVTAPVFQQVGHLIGGATGGNTFGGILNGTLADPKNKGVEAADTTAKQTKRTADEIVNLQKQLAGQGNPNVPGGGVAAGGGSDPSALVPGLVGVTYGDLAKAGAGVGSSVASSSSSGLFGGLLAKLFPSLGTSLGNFGLGVSSVASGGALSILTGQSQGPLAEQIGAGVGIGGALALGGLGIAQGVSQGGAQGDLKAAGAAAGIVGAAVGNVAKLLGAASPALTAIPIVGTILAAALPLVGSLFGNNVEQRQKDITNELAKNQYLAPTALNVTQNGNGTYEDFDSRGLLRTSTLNALPTVTEPFITSRVIDGQRVYANAPGQSTSPFSGSATGTGQGPVSNANAQVVHNHYYAEGAIQTMDGSNFHDFLQKPGPNLALGEGVATHLQRHEGRASNMIRDVTGTN